VARLATGGTFVSTSEGQVVFRAILRLIRPRILATCYAIAFLGAVVAGSITLKTILIGLVLILWYIHAASVNDYSDHHIDKINLKDAVDRPLITEDASVRQLWQINIVAGILAILASAIFGIQGVLFTIGMLVIDYMYSLKPLRISDRGILSQLLLAFAYVYFPFTLGYWSSQSSEAYPWLVSIGLYLAFIARLLLKDFRDIKGDKQHGKMTFVLRHGVAATCLTSAIFWFLALVFICYASAVNAGLTAVLIIGLFQALYLLKILANSSSKDSHERIVALIAKTANITLISVLIFYLAKAQPNISDHQISILVFVPGFCFLGLNFCRAIQWKRIN